MAQPEKDEHGIYAEPVTMYHPKQWHDCEHERKHETTGQWDTDSPATKECNPTMEVGSASDQKDAASGGWITGKPKTRAK